MEENICMYQNPTTPDGGVVSRNLPKCYDHLVAGIVLCAIFGPFGLPTLMCHIKAMVLWRRGLYDDAILSSQISGRWITPSIIMGIIAIIQYIIFYAFYFYLFDYFDSTYYF